MKQEALAYFTDIHLTLLGMFLFITFFISLLLWVFKKENNEVFKYVETLPLKDGDNL